MKILVLGGNGFIGSHLIDLLIRNKYEVRVFDRQYEIFRKPLPNVDYHIGDFGNKAMLSYALQDIDIVFHLISTTVPKTSNDDPCFDVISNVIESISLLQECIKAHVKKIIFVSSGGAIYGPIKKLPVPENNPTNPYSSYGISKLMIEKYMTLYKHLHGLDYVIVRPSNPYGPRQNHNSKQGVIAVFLNRIKNKKKVEIWGDGETVKDYIFIDDLVEGIYKVAFNKTRSKIFNIGSGVGYSVNNIVEIITEITEQDINIEYKPAGKHDVPKIVLDIKRCKQELTWQPKTFIKDGISQTWDFFRR